MSNFGHFGDFEVLNSVCKLSLSLNCTVKTLNFTVQILISCTIFISFILFYPNVLANYLVFKYQNTPLLLNKTVENCEFLLYIKYVIRSPITPFRDLVDVVCTLECARKRLHMAP